MAADIAHQYTGAALIGRTMFDVGEEPRGAEPPFYLARQYLEAGLLDEFQLHLVPILLGDGVRLFEASGTSP